MFKQFYKDIDELHKLITPEVRKMTYLGQMTERLNRLIAATADSIYSVERFYNAVSSATKETRKLTNAFLPHYYND